MGKVLRPAAIRLPPTPFGRVRLFLLVLAQIGALSGAVMALSGSGLYRVLGVVAAIALGAYWVVGYRRGGRSQAGSSGIPQADRA